MEMTGLITITANLESSICGVIAGFALTVVVMLVGKNNDSGNIDDKRQGVIAIFTAVLFISLLASYQFALAAADKEQLHAFISLTSPAFCLALSSTLLMYGVLMLLSSYNLMYAFNRTKLIFNCVILIAILSIHIQSFE